MQSKAELTFEPRGHVYRYGGRVVPSVTQILSILQDYSAVDGELMEEARRRGRHVHEMIDLDNRGALDEEALDEELLPYLQQWRQFLRDTGFIVTSSEQRVYHQTFGYAGTADAGSMEGTSWVLDVKTGSMPRSVGAQLAAYQAALTPRPRRRLCLVLTRNHYRLHECKKLSDFSLFQSCLNIWRFHHGA
jgi:hypothetical protein